MRLNDLRPAPGSKPKGKLISGPSGTMKTRRASSRSAATGSKSLRPSAAACARSAVSPHASNS